ncbi:MAG: exodeoxyribonuclease large subunit [Thermomicrobiales bacterium]|jgi:exodeoxyribonuclease VII large subunit|nr:exodeoxyribonuclease large subunit [Thermomicrobiales bacterium]
MTARLLPVGAFVCLFREALESDSLYQDLWLEGEVSDLSRSSPGHVYFSLRDEDGCLKCVLFRGQALRQHHTLRIGDQVIVHGGLSIYPRSGAVQLVADLVQPAGLGAASLELEYLRQRLEAEGLFDPLRKRPLPTSPGTIGVVTSLHGAAWHDIVDVVARRYPLADLVLSPAQVQGAGAAESIVRALQSLLREVNVDVVILARGGGATDDLSAFNDEQVVRAVFASRVPVVTGVGHATDRTLVEDVADVYAATPSAAAEVCVPSIAELGERLLSLESRLIWSLAACRANGEAALHAASRRLAASDPLPKLHERRSDIVTAATRLRSAVTDKVSRGKQCVAGSGDVLTALDPVAVLERGYAALQRSDDALPIFSVAQAEPGTKIVAVLADGALKSSVEISLPSSRSAAVS